MTLDLGPSTMLDTRNIDEPCEDCLCEACRDGRHEDCTNPMVLDADSNEVDYECCCGLHRWLVNIGPTNSKL